MVLKKIRLLDLIAAAIMTMILTDLAYAGAAYIYEMANPSDTGYAGAGLAGRAGDAGTVFTNPAGMTRFKESDEGMWSEKRDLIFDDLDHAYFDNAQNPEALTSGGFSEHTLASLFGRINYNYAEKYLF